MRELSWTQFDQAVSVLAKRYSAISMTGIYGVPRGGLCLAVALSHALQQPLLSDPVPDALIVDDVYETGRTLQALHARCPNARFSQGNKSHSECSVTTAACHHNGGHLLTQTANRAFGQRACKA